MSHPKLYLALSAVVGIVGAGLLAAPAASALKVRQSPYNCHVTGGNAVDSSYGIGNDSPSSAALLRCDVPYPVRQNPAGTYAMTVHGRDGSTVDSFGVLTCESFRTSVGGSCSPGTSSANADVKNVTLSPSTSVWNDDSNPSYVTIRLPARQGSSRSQVWGITYFWD